MDYDSPLFIAAVKKILRENLAHLTDSLNDLENSVKAHWQADEKRYETKPVTITNFRTDIPVSVKTYAQRSTKEKIWGATKGILEIAVGVAVISYTCISYENWLQVIDATNFASRQTELSRKALNETAKQFRVDQRPMIRISLISSGSAGSNLFTFKENDPFK
jgi:hypothetical protein